jgi:hypothetical protein
LSDVLTPKGAELVLALMREGFFDDEIRDQMLEGYPLWYQEMSRGELAGAIASIRRGFKRSRPGRPPITGPVHGYRWRRAVERAGSTTMAAVALHYRMQSGARGLVGEGTSSDPAAVESRCRYLRRLRSKFRDFE